jgi:hypothetical protein
LSERLREFGVQYVEASFQTAMRGTVTHEITDELQFKGLFDMHEMWRFESEFDNR